MNETASKRARIIFAVLFALLFIVNLLTGSGIFGALVRAFIITLVLGGLFQLVRRFFLKAKNTDAESITIETDDADNAAVGPVAPEPKRSHMDDEMFNIVTDGRYRMASEGDSVMGEHKEEEAIRMENAMIEEDFAPESEFDVPEDVGMESEKQKASSGSSKSKKLGKYVLINKRKILNDPENFAMAIKTMMARDDD